MSFFELARIISKYARMPFDQLLTCAENPKLATIEGCIVSLFVKSHKEGNYQTLAFLMDRCVGKVKEIEEDDEDRLARAELQGLTNEELLRKLAEKIPQLNSTAKAT